MSAVCPRCQGTAFDPVGSDLACRGCGAVLPGFTFPEAADARLNLRLAETRAGRAVNWAAVAVGVAVFGAGVAAAVSAARALDRCKVTKATVTVTRTVHGREKAFETRTHVYVWEKYTEERTAAYMADGVKYHIDPPGAAANGQQFDVYYDPKHPAGGSRLPPVVGVVLAGLVGLVGLALVALGFGIGGDYFTRRETFTRLAPLPRRRRPAGPDSSPNTTTA